MPANGLYSLTPAPKTHIRQFKFPGGTGFRSLGLIPGSPSASALRPQVPFRFALGPIRCRPHIGATRKSGVTRMFESLSERLGGVFDRLT